MNGPRESSTLAIEPQAPSPEPTRVPVVALGGSAGAFTEFKDFLSRMPKDTGAAFVVIQHLSPVHGSMLPELLAPSTEMSVVQARGSTPVEANCVYVIQPGTDLEIRQGILYAIDHDEKLPRAQPIDLFFRSLAQEQGDRAISVLFSGAGSDGVEGMQAIRMAGGVALVQSPETARFDTMPRNAVDAGAVDFVLSPAEIPAVVLKYLCQPFVRLESAADENSPEEPASPHIPEILALIFARTGHDFSAYKKGTMGRRIHHRMTLNNISDDEVYCEILRQKPFEVELLVKDLLINTTAFFRDPEVFDELQVQIIKPMVQMSAPDDFLRVWVPGCASGEEAYSLAMLFSEEIESSGKSCRLQVFATDIDTDALDFARRAVYPESATKDIAPHRLEKFFVRRDGSLQIAESVRKSVVFAVQNLMADPPFSKMNLVSCRNLLIYLEPRAQAKVLRVFAFALNVGGCLVLGKSETIGEHDALFHTVSRTSRIYQRLLNARPALLDTALPHGKKVLTPPAGAVADRVPPKSLGDTLRHALLNHFSASAVLIDKVGNVLQFFGDTERFLNLPEADPSFNIFDLAKGTLANRIQSALRRILHEGASATHEEVVCEGANGQFLVRISVEPTENREKSPVLAIIFEDVGPVTRISTPSPFSPTDSARINELEQDLRTSQRDLRSTIEDLQAANEQLRISNEEVLSSNEELQSTNEELGTSQEELQSLNEELTTVNNELQLKIQTLDSLHNDMVNLLNSTEIATLFLDSDLRIKYFTPATTKVLNLISTDIGRPVSHFSMRLVNCSVAETAHAVLKSGHLIEQNAQDSDNRNYFVRFMPYRTTNGSVAGVVITFGDVTALLAAEAAQAANTAKTMFLANMSHELRTPLNAIVGFCELLKSDTLTAAQRAEFLDIMLQNASQLVSLIDDILDISMVENGKVVLHGLPVSPRKLLEDVRRLLAPLAETGNIGLSVATSGDVPEAVLTDRKKLTQILTNIIGNAIKFTPAGGRIQAEIVFQGELLKFVVSDSGAGVPLEERERIFDVFQRGPNLSNRNVAGTGLGLALSRKIARIMGGDVHLAESVVGRGSTFVVTVKAPRTTLAPDPEREPEIDAQALPLKNCKVLVAENDPSSRRLMQEMLAFLGATVFAVEDGEKAVDAAMSGSFHVVLMDLMMPEKDGFTATRELRNQSYRGAIVAVSAQALAEHRRDAMAAGCNGHLTKPISMHDLILELKKYC